MNICCGFFCSSSNNKKIEIIYSFTFGKSSLPFLKGITISIKQEFVFY